MQDTSVNLAGPLLQEGGHRSAVLSGKVFSILAVLVQGLGLAALLYSVAGKGGERQSMAQDQMTMLTALQPTKTVARPVTAPVVQTPMSRGWMQGLSMGPGQFQWAEPRTVRVFQKGDEGRGGQVSKGIKREEEPEEYWLSE